MTARAHLVTVPAPLAVVRAVVAPLLMLLIALLAAPWAAAQVNTKTGAALAYVPNEGSATISVIDTLTDQVIAELPGGSKPRGLAIGADRRWLYVSDQPNNRLQLVDLKTRTLGSTIALGESPEGVSISPDGRWVATAVEGRNEIAVTDSRNNALSFSIKVHGKNPEHAVFSPNGKLLFVSAEEG
jgi:YVTN family beta-propeller protein